MNEKCIYTYKERIFIQINENKKHINGEFIFLIQLDYEFGNLIIINNKNNYVNLNTIFQLWYVKFQLLKGQTQANLV